MPSTNKPQREIRYDPDSLRRAIKKNAETIALYRRYIEKLTEENQLMEDCLTRELELRDKEDRANGRRIR